MNHSKTELHFLLVLLLGVGAISFLVFKPFLYTLILALIFSTVFWSLHEKVLRVTRGRNALSALLSTLCVLVVIIVPLTILSLQIFRESTQLYAYLASNGGVTDLSRSVNTAIQDLITISGAPITFSVDADQYVTQGLRWLLQHMGALFASLANVTLHVFLFLIALYYLFKDGHKLKKAVFILSPLQDQYDETIFNKIAVAMNSVIRGGLVVALVQGVLTAVGFALFGVPNPTLWGSVATIAALVPGVGTALVLLPAILYLFFSGETVLAAGLLIWGVTAVGLVDNFLGPTLAGRGMRIHSFLILLSILGGLIFFGPLGFLFGPLLLSLLFVLLEIYSLVSKNMNPDTYALHR